MDQDPRQHWLSGRAWLGRLALSFIIIGCVLAWTAYRAAAGYHGEVPQWRVVFYLVAAAMAFVLGVAGLRQRHRTERGTPDSR